MHHPKSYIPQYTYAFENNCKTYKRVMCELGFQAQGFAVIREHYDELNLKDRDVIKGISQFVSDDFRINQGFDVHMIK